MILRSAMEQAGDAYAQGDLSEAERICLESLVAAPDTPQMHHQLALVYAGQGRAEEALTALDRALAIQPGNFDSLMLRGDMLMVLKRFSEALACFDRGMAFRQQTPHLLHTRGHALKALGRDDEALNCFERALALQPDYLPALYERGTLLAARHRIADWFAGFRKFSERWVGAAAWSAVGGEPNPPPPHKGLHDAEQRDYQRECGIIVTGERPHIVGGEKLSGPAINPLNAAAAGEAWRAGKIVVIDNLLTEEALVAMRRYCWGSTLWRSVYNAGYIGAFPEQGFNSPLLAQIVEEFRTVFSDICGDHALKYVWGFKYDSALEGIAIHADAAAVNVNFWITPDDANLDPESGGLVVWDVAAPLDWDFTKFNTDEKAIRDFLAQSGAKPVVIPYRANRAVIFDSDLFHQTDAIRFKPGYQNRRINVTLLYGERDTETLG